MDRTLEEMRDKLAKHSAELDQVQASLDLARLMFKDEAWFQEELDQHQAKLNKTRGDIAQNLARIKELA